MKFKVKYALGGGFGGCENVEGEICEFDTLKEAEDYAYDMACETYEQYEGLHGLRDIDQIIEEEECDEDDAYEIYDQERESWLDYEVTEYDPREEVLE